MEACLIDDEALGLVDDDVLAKDAADNFEAFAELYRRYLCPIYRYMRTQTPSDPIAEDLTAQVFFKALSAASSFRGDSSYQTWLFRIAHNVMLSWRRHSDRSVVVVEDVPDGLDPARCPATHAEVNEQRQLVWRTVRRLPRAQQEVVTLRYLQDLSIEEVADISGRSRGAVRILLHRARTRLRHELERGTDDDR